MAESLRNKSVSIDNAMAVPMACRADLAAAVIRLRTQSRSSPAVRALCAAAQKRSVWESVETEALSLFSTPSDKLPRRLDRGIGTYANPRSVRV